MFKPEDFNSFSTFLLASEAQKRGIKVEKIFPEEKSSYLKLTYKNNRQTIFGQRISPFGYDAHMICKKKEMTRRFLGEKGIKTTKGKMFNKEEIYQAVDFSDEIGFPVVVKPPDGTWGADVFLNLKSSESVLNAIGKVIEENSKFLVEKQFEGEEYRVLATRSKLLGVVNRIPANVIGDGKSTIRELIEEKNQDPRRGDGHRKSLVKIEIDEKLLKNLKEKELDLNSIPKKEAVVYLRKTSNLSRGGDSIDITDKIHPKIKELALRIISAIPNLPYGGIDFLTPDITKDPEKVGYAVIEINDSPMLSMHCIPYKGKERNVAKEIINLAFPETI